MGVISPIKRGKPFEVLGSQRANTQADVSQEVKFTVGNWAKVEKRPNYPKAEPHNRDRNANRKMQGVIKFDQFHVKYVHSETGNYEGRKGVK